MPKPDVSAEHKEKYLATERHSSGGGGRALPAVAVGATAPPPPPATPEAEAAAMQGCGSSKAQQDGSQAALQYS